jgi:hypothetical protein
MSAAGVNFEAVTCPLGKTFWEAKGQYHLSGWPGGGEARFSECVGRKY